jgi:hypothetical protein
VSTSSSSGSTSCCENDLVADVQIGEVICYKTQYGLKVSVCNGAQCETTRGLKHTVNGRDLGNGSSENKCASSPLEFKFSTPLGSSIEFKGKVAGRVWSCGEVGPLLPGQSNQIRRETLTSENTATWTNTTKCPCCQNYNYSEEGATCPEGKTLKAVGSYQCPEGSRTCYKCEEASGSGPALFMAMDEISSIFDLLEDI